MMNSQTSAVAQPLRGALSVAPIRSLGELEDLRAGDLGAYGWACLPFTVYREWWERYPHGLLALRNEHGAIVGGMGLWPVEYQTLVGLCAGTRRERDIRSRDIGDAAGASRCPYWYASGLVLDRGHRGTGAAGVLLAGAFATLLYGIRPLFPIGILALGYSPKGIAVLKWLGFEAVRSASEGPDGQSVHVLYLGGRSEAQRLLSRVVDRASRRPPWRCFVGIDLKAEYLAMARQRIRGDATETHSLGRSSARGGRS